MNKQKDDIDRLERRLLAERARVLGKQVQLADITRSVRASRGSGSLGVRAQSTVGRENSGVTRGPEFLLHVREILARFMSSSV